jgi:hypothetical protein
MKTIWTTLGAVALIALLTLSTVQAQEAATPAAAPPPATEPAPQPAATPTDTSKDFELTIDGKESDGEGHGVRITIGDDDKSERADLAGKVVERVADKLEDSLSGLPEDVRRDIEPDVRELRSALADIRELKHDTVHTHHRNGEDTLTAIAGMMVPIVLFGCVVLMVGIVSFNNRRKRQMVHETIDRIISQGKDVPVELLDALDKGRNGKSLLQRGIFWLGLGIGLGGCFFIWGGLEAAALGLLPICIGIARLLSWKLEKPRDDGAPVS